MDGFVITLETGFTFVLVNVIGFLVWGGGGGRGAERTDISKFVGSEEI